MRVRTKKRLRQPVEGALDERVDDGVPFDEEAVDEGFDGVRFLVLLESIDDDATDETVLVAQRLVKVRVDGLVVHQGERPRDSLPHEGILVFLEIFDDSLERLVGSGFGERETRSVTIVPRKSTEDLQNDVVVALLLRVESLPALVAAVRIRGTEKALDLLRRQLLLLADKRRATEERRGRAQEHEAPEAYQEATEDFWAGAMFPGHHFDSLCHLTW